MIASGRVPFRVLFTGVLNKDVFCDFILCSCFVWFESETDLPCIMYRVFYIVFTLYLLARMPGERYRR